jgi:NAD(P)-dependent dehydrogenase (short-subunit alcohol dehydrogenase family)
MSLSDWNVKPGFPLALVTGGAHRLGKVLALALARRGYAILVHYHSSTEEAAVTLDEIRTFGVPAFLHCADLRADDGVSSLVAFADALLNNDSNQLARFAVLVNSAALMPRGDARSISAAQWDATLALNLRAPFLLSQAAARRMTEGGLIVNMSDVGAQKAWSSFPAYTVSKAGLDAMTRVLARAFAPSVRVNAIAPGLVLPPNDLPPEEWYRLTAKTPLKRPADTQEIAAALDFLLDDEYVTGQVISVDGGYSLV